MTNHIWLNTGLTAIFARLAMSGAVAATPPEDAPEVAASVNATEGDITLPDEAAPEAREAASHGLGQANAAREDGRAYGGFRADAAAGNSDAGGAASMGAARCGAGVVLYPAPGTVDAIAEAPRRDNRNPANNSQANPGEFLRSSRPLQMEKSL